MARSFAMSLNQITIRNLGPEEAHVLDRVRPGVFGDEMDPSRVWAFLATRVNELVVALDMGEVVGFVCGTVLMHPGRATEFLVQEVSVHPDVAGDGVEARLLARITELALDRGCEGLVAIGRTSEMFSVVAESAEDGLTRYQWVDLQD